MAENLNNGCLDWDSVLESDGQEYIVLPEGEYNFVVTDIEKGRYPGSAKLPACNKATVTLQVKTKDGIADVKADLILHEKLLFKLTSFFRCIGLKKHGEKVTMDWNKVIGSRGHAYFKPRKYTDKDGNERQVNDVERYFDFDPKYFPAEEEDFSNLPF